ncbi:MAG: flavodoxin family protein [Dehalococcoidaceae bacterium]|nr:flavodoxin family protein [Dehalococcoidaceae bacterium]
MKVIAFNASPRKQGNTRIVIEHTLKQLNDMGFETGIIHLFDYTIQPCQGCNECREGEHCPINDDLMNLYEIMKRADGIIMASPVYFGSATPPLKALIDRTGYIARNNGYVFKGKAGAPIAVTARDGGNFTIAQIAFWYYYNGLIMPGSTSWNVVYGEEIGDVLQDTRGLEAMTEFGINLGNLLTKLADK